MSLRIKLLLGYLVFVTALMALGGWSAWQLRQLGSVSRLIIAENYDSVVAAQQMKENLERQDSATLFLSLGQRERAVAQIQEHQQKFDEALEKAAHNITDRGDNFNLSFFRNVMRGLFQRRIEFLLMFLDLRYRAFTLSQ